MSRALDKLQVHRYTHHDVYFGTAAELIGAGLLKLDQLPGQPGRPFATVFYRRGEQVEPVRRFDTMPDSQDWMRVTRVDSDSYRLDVGLPKDERARRRQDNARRHREWAEKCQREREVVTQAVARQVSVGITETDFRQRMGDALLIAAVRILSHFKGHDEEASLPFRFAAEEYEGVRERLAVALEAIASAKVVPVLTGLDAARADGSFQQFLASQCLKDSG
jgi:hypothetical protein